MPQILPVTTKSHIEVTAHKDIGGEATEVATVPVTGGTVVLETGSDGSLLVPELTLALADVRISSMNVALTGIEVVLTQQTGEQTAWAPDDESAAVTTTVDLELRWLLVAFGHTLPLGAIRLAGLSLFMTVTGDGGHVSVTLQGQQDGRFWSWSGLLDLSDLGIHLEAGTR